MSDDDLAEALYCAVTPQPRPSWRRLRQRARDRFVAAANAVQRAREPYSIGLLRLLQNVAADCRREQLWRMRHGKF